MNCSTLGKQNKVKIQKYCKCSDTNIFKFQCPTWLFPSYGYPFICGNNERHWQSRYCYLVLELQLTMIIKLLQTVLYLESWQLLIMVKDNRLGGVDNICVLRRRMARNAVTRPTTGHSEDGRSEDKRGTDRRHGVITKLEWPILYVFDIGGLGSVIFIKPRVWHSSGSGISHHLMFET